MDDFQQLALERDVERMKVRVLLRNPTVTGSQLVDIGNRARDKITPLCQDNIWIQDDHLDSMAEDIRKDAPFLFGTAVREAAPRPRLSRDELARPARERLRPAGSASWRERRP